jgi:hypothetical protein
MWDAISKFAVSARRQVGLRDDKGRLPVHEYGFEYAGRACRLELHPASVKVGDRFRDFYPSADEELVEEVLRKIFADQTYGIHVVESLESWVRSSLHMIRTELHARGKTRSLDEIKRSIDILATTIVRVYVEGAGDDAITPSRSWARSSRGGGRRAPETIRRCGPPACPPCSPRAPTT